MTGADTDLGLWNLMGTDVEMLGAAGAVSVDHSPVDVTKQPSKTAESIRWLADIGLLTESATLNPACPTAATGRGR